MVGKVELGNGEEGAKTRRFALETQMDQKTAFYWSLSQTGGTESRKQVKWY